MIYLIESPIDFKWKQEAKYNYALSTNRFIFTDGEYLPKNKIDKPIIFDLKIKKKEALFFDNIINNSSCLLVNHKIIDILNKFAPEEIQLFDTEIRCKDDILLNYKLVNLTEKVQGIDHEKSLYTWIGNEADGLISLKRLVLKENCLGLLKIALLEEFPGHILATEEIKQAFESARITGLRFVTPEDYYADIYPNYAQRQITHSQLVIQFYQSHFKDDKFLDKLENTVKNNTLDAAVTAYENNDDALSVFIATMDPIKTFTDVSAIFKDQGIDDKRVKAGYCAFSSDVYIRLWPKDLEEFKVT